MISACVFGQVVVDEVVADSGSVAVLPKEQRPFRIGGKGFNLAVALARLGCHVMIVSAVGDDEAGAAAKAELEREKVSTEYLVHGSLDRGTIVRTPHVMLTEGRYGERQVSVAIDARIMHSYKAAVFRARRATCEMAFYTLEYPADILPMLAATLRVLKANTDCLVVGNPAPRPGAIGSPSLTEVMRIADVLTPNRFEATVLTGGEAVEMPDGECARRIGEIYGVPYVFVTHGDRGWAWASHQSDSWRNGTSRLAPAAVVDKVGASDVFTAAAGVAVSLGAGVEAAGYTAGTAAKFAVGRAGGAEAFPTVTEIRRAAHDDGSAIARQMVTATLDLL